MQNIPKKIILITLVLAASTINANILVTLFAENNLAAHTEIVQVAFGEESENSNANYHSNGNDNGNFNSNHNGSITTSNSPSKNSNNMKVIISE